MKKLFIAIACIFIYSISLFARIDMEKSSNSLTLNEQNTIKEIVEKSYIKTDIFDDLNKPEKKKSKNPNLNAIDFQKGVASFYGERWNGRRTANGEIFDTSQLTAAHKTLPFGTLVKVTNVKNGKSIVVRINDRGPYINGRVIDLTKAAFAKIEDIDKGVTKVKLEKVKSI